MKKETDTKQRLFEMMSKLDNSFKPKVNENIDEISTGMAQNAAQKAFGKYSNNYNVLSGAKRLNQYNKFGGYINPELKNYIKQLLGNNVTIFKNSPNEVYIKIPLKNFYIGIYIKPDEVKLLRSGYGKSEYLNADQLSKLLPNVNINKLIHIVKSVQADLRGEKSKFNPSTNENIDEIFGWSSREKKEKEINQKIEMAKQEIQKNNPATLIFCNVPESNSNESKKRCMVARINMTKKDMPVLAELMPKLFDLNQRYVYIAELYNEKLLPGIIPENWYDIVKGKNGLIDKNETIINLNQKLDKLL